MFKLDWGTYLTTSESVIYAVIDGRGSGFRGDDLLFELYYNVGGPEVEDQLDVTRQLLKRFAFIDRSRVAIWGWSYGGKATHLRCVPPFHTWTHTRSCRLRHTICPGSRLGAWPHFQMRDSGGTGDQLDLLRFSLCWTLPRPTHARRQPQRVSGKPPSRLLSHRNPFSCPDSQTPMFPSALEIRPHVQGETPAGEENAPGPRDCR